jgi:hypothetical protein
LGVQNTLIGPLLTGSRLNSRRQPEASVITSVATFLCTLPLIRKPSDGSQVAPACRTVPLANMPATFTSSDHTNRATDISTESSVENRTQAHGKLNGFSFPHIMYLCVCVYIYIYTYNKIYHMLRAGVGNDLLRVSDMLDIEENKTSEERVLNLPHHFHKISSLYRFA